jgi:hypothetical protein
MHIFYAAARHHTYGRKAAIKPVYVQSNLMIQKRNISIDPQCGQAHKATSHAVFVNCQLKFSTKLSTGLWKASLSQK